jgi:ABC-type phosphate/phosphonate transport system permease subunit
LLCAIPNEMVRWLIVFGGGLIACLFITLNLRRQLQSFEDQRRKSAVLLLAGAAQIGLSVALSIEFFSYSGTLAPTK